MRKIDVDKLEPILISIILCPIINKSVLLCVARLWSSNGALVCRVGTGISDAELKTVRDKLEPYFTTEKPKNYKVTSSRKVQPDVWIKDVSKSIVLQVTNWWQYLLHSCRPLSFFFATLRPAK